MINRKDRKNYWNVDYVEYWKDKIDVANDETKQDITEGDSKTSSDIAAYNLFGHISYKKDDRLLDFGCGFGRFFDYFNNGMKQDYYGIDISKAMLEEFVKVYPASRKKVQVSEGEELPFENSFFQHVICYGVFDACYQEQALQEMIRVCKQGGDICISGKSVNYFIDDEMGLVAERNARRKGHPNYFTDMSKMKKILMEHSISIVYEKYYLRRVDLENDSAVESEPDKFYAWALILRKNKNLTIKNFEKFSFEYSNTWKQSGWSE